MKGRRRKVPNLGDQPGIYTPMGGFPDHKERGNRDIVMLRRH
jgi:hypothetical protein